MLNHWKYFADDSWYNTSWILVTKGMSCCPHCISFSTFFKYMIYFLFDRRLKLQRYTLRNSSWRDLWRSCCRLRTGEKYPWIHDRTWNFCRIQGWFSQWSGIRRTCFKYWRFTWESWDVPWWLPWLLSSTFSYHRFIHSSLV